MKKQAHAHLNQRLQVSASDARNHESGKNKAHHHGMAKMVHMVHDMAGGLPQSLT